MALLSVSGLFTYHDHPTQRGCYPLCQRSPVALRPATAPGGQRCPRGVQRGGAGTGTGGMRGSWWMDTRATAVGRQGVKLWVGEWSMLSMDVEGT